MENHSKHIQYDSLGHFVTCLMNLDKGLSYTFFEAGGINSQYLSQMKSGCSLDLRYYINFIDCILEFFSFEIDIQALINMLKDAFQHKKCIVMRSVNPHSSEVGMGVVIMKRV